MDLARRVYHRDLKIAVMQEIDRGRSVVEVARQFELSPKLLERWRGEWRARGELAFPGVGRQTVEGPGLEQAQRIAALERKIGQLTMENDWLKKALQHFRAYHPPAFVNGQAACTDKSGKESRRDNGEPVLYQPRS